MKFDNKEKMNSFLSNAFKSPRQGLCFSERSLQNQQASLDLGEEMKKIDIQQTKQRIRNTLAINNQKEVAFEALGSFSIAGGYTNSSTMKMKNKIITLSQKLNLDQSLFHTDRITLNIQEFYDQFHVQKSIGEGCIGLVKKVQHKSTGQYYAVKFVATDNEEVIRSMIIEFTNLVKISHDNVVKMHHLFLNFNDSFQSESQALILMELVEGQEMFQVISTLGCYDENTARNLFKQLLNSIKFLHENGICHRDLKPHNILCQENTNKIKVTDFNVSKFLDAQKEFGNLRDILHLEMWTYTGTIAYSAPERFSGEGYNFMVDMWSAGCILYTMLSGQLPFNGNYLNDLINEISTKTVQFDDKYFKGVSNEAKDLILSLLNKDPSQRLSCSSALNHYWFANDVSAFTLKNFSLANNLQHLSAKSGLGQYKVILSQVSNSSRFSSRINNNYSEQSFEQAKGKKNCTPLKRAYNYNQTQSFRQLDEDKARLNDQVDCFSDNMVCYKNTEEESESIYQSYQII